jgi:hypothetical protein
MVTTRLNATSPELIAPCGIDCRLCRRMFSKEKRTCPGCRGEDTYKARGCVECRIKNCEKLVSGKFTYCYECDEYPCATLAHLDKRYRTRYATSPLENLQSIQLNGIGLFIEAENKKWTCPHCGSMLCMHDPLCRSCGYAWH